MIGQLPMRVFVIGFLEHLYQIVISSGPGRDQHCFASVLDMISSQRVSNVQEHTIHHTYVKRFVVDGSHIDLVIQRPITYVFFI